MSRHRASRVDCFPNMSVSGIQPHSDSGFFWFDRKAPEKKRILYFVFFPPNWNWFVEWLYIYTLCGDTTNSRWIVLFVWFRRSTPAANWPVPFLSATEITVIVGRKKERKGNKNNNTHTQGQGKRKRPLASGIVFCFLSSSCYSPEGPLAGRGSPRGHWASITICPDVEVKA